MKTEVINAVLEHKLLNDVRRTVRSDNPTDVKLGNIVLKYSAERLGSDLNVSTEGMGDFIDKIGNSIKKFLTKADEDFTYVNDNKHDIYKVIQTLNGKLKNITKTTPYNSTIKQDRVSSFFTTNTVDFKTLNIFLEVAEDIVAVRFGVKHSFLDDVVEYCKEYIKAKDKLPLYKKKQQLFRNYNKYMRHAKPYENKFGDGWILEHFPHTFSIHCVVSREDGDINSKADIGAFKTIDNKVLKLDEIKKVISACEDFLNNLEIKTGNTTTDRIIDYIDSLHSEFVSKNKDDSLSAEEKTLVEENIREVYHLYETMMDLHGYLFKGGHPLYVVNNILHFLKLCIREYE